MKKSLLMLCRSEEEEVELRQNYVHATLLRKILVEKLQKDIDASHNASLNADYDLSNWALKQAHEIGYQKALKDIIALISEKE